MGFQKMLLKRTEAQKIQGKYVFCALNAGDRTVKSPRILGIEERPSDCPKLRQSHATGF
jgi:hypothetical protein